MQQRTSPGTRRDKIDQSWLSSAAKPGAREAAAPMPTAAEE